MRTKPVQPYLFEIESEPLELSVYFDSAGKYGKDQWLVWGLLFVKTKDEEEILQTLKKERIRQECESVIHFSALPASYGGEGGAKPRTAFGWISSAYNFLQSSAQFYALAVDTKDDKFRHERFSRLFHLHNRFTLMAMVAAIPWFFKGTDSIRLAPFFHRQTFEGIGQVEEGLGGQDWDNLGTYIVSQLVLEAQGRHQASPHLWPRVEFTHEVIFLPLDPNEAESKGHKPRCELLQFTDLALGCSREAIAGEAERQTKLELASIVGEWMADTRLRPWEQQLGLHRRFCVNYFPGAHGPEQQGPLRLSRRLPSARQYSLGLRRDRP